MDWKEKIDNIHKKHLNGIEKGDPSQIIYHYSSPTGVMGIFNSSSLWFSDSDFLNDASESYYFAHVFDDAYRDGLGSDESRKKGNFFSKASILAFFHTEVFGKERQTAERIREYRYILSLSTDSDNISLWNYYTKTPGNIGYCIGFDVDTLIKSLNTDQEIVHGTVIYERDEQVSILKAFINDYWGIYNELKYTYQREYLYKMMEHNLVIYSVFMKDPAFAYENEYRIAIITTDMAVQNKRSFREVNGSFVPYITNKIDLTSVKEIGVSPTHRVGFSKKSIKEFAESKGIQADIFSSDIPIRY